METNRLTEFILMNTHFTKITGSTAYSSTYNKLAVLCSADSLLVNQTFILGINIYGKERQLLVAHNR